MRSIAFALAAVAAATDAGASGPREFRDPRLLVPEAHQPLSALGPRATELRAELASLNLPPEAGLYDVRAGRWSGLLPREPLIPGDGADNTLAWADLGIAGRPTTAQLEKAAWTALAGYLERAKALRVDRTELGPPRVTVHDDGRIVQLWVPRVFGGVPVRDSALAAVVGHGNLVLLGLSHWADAPAPADPAVDGERARRAAAAHAGAGWRAHGAPRLEYVPFADPAPAETYGFRLAWAVEGRIAGSVATWEALVDAGTGRLLAFEDRNLSAIAAARRLVGGVYPLSNDGTTPDGTEQPGYPMPFADLSLPDGTTAFTNSSGLACVLPPLPGPAPLFIETRLSGRYVRIADACGPLLDRFRARSRVPADLGVSAGTDCVVPPGRSAGDTHAARTAFYELNRMNEQARGYLPANAWLQTQLVANTNVNLTCGATWSGTAVHFYRGGACGNPGEIASIVSHEWGHGLDDNGADPTISNPAEAIADIHAILRHNDSCVGRGLRPQAMNCPGYGDPCTSCTGARDLDWARHQSGLPHDIAWVQTRCPSGASVCGRQPHCAGIIVAEAVWDLQARDLPEQFGLDTNSALEVATRLAYLGGGLVGTWYQCTPPSGGCGTFGGYMSFLAVDDDNGNLLDGTPHATAIHAAFNRHQIACATPPPVNSGCAGGPATSPLLTATALPGAVMLSWSAVPGAGRYDVYRADGMRGCAIGKVELGEAAGTSFTDAGLLGGYAYHYTVVPVGANGSCFGPMSACETAVPNGLAMCRP